MKITFYGARAQIPTPGPETQRFGGNTHCILLTSNDGQKLLVNAGSGLRFASHEFEDYRDPIHLLLSQHHWDHIQGFPFFDSIKKPQQQIMIYPANTNEDHDIAILDQINKTYTVDKFHLLPSTITIKKTKFNLPEPVQIGDFSVQAMKVNHPGGGSAYKISCDDKTVVICNNNELFAPPQHNYHSFEEWCLFCQYADLLIHDARYMNADMTNHVGNGHSCLGDAIELANAAEVKMLCMSCLDPSSSDELLDFLNTRLFADRLPFSFFFAKEGRQMHV
ncbi:MBL fold metallo-hydrolase [Psychrosphaera haliotis]|nr:MBL fold metallo-hydrolase [Psychrosphaera haliotis]